MLRYPSYKIHKTWQIDENLKKDKEGWEYFLEDEKSYGDFEKIEGKKLTTRRRKWTLFGEKQLDFSDGVS